MKPDPAEYEAWLADRPPIVQEIGRRIRPWRFYTLRHPSGDSYDYAVYVPYSISEDGTVTVDKFEWLLGGWSQFSVFGVSPKDLRELPEEFNLHEWTADADYAVGKEE